MSKDTKLPPDALSSGENMLEWLKVLDQADRLSTVASEQLNETCVCKQLWVVMKS